MEQENTYIIYGYHRSGEVIATPSLEVAWRLKEENEEPFILEEIPLHD